MVNYTGVQLTLLLGAAVPVPAPLDVLDALLKVTVTQRDDGPSTCQISLRADQSTALSFLNPIVGNPALAPYNRAIVVVTVAMVPTVLFDGLVTHHQFTPGVGTSPPVFTVTCEDISVVMALQEKSEEYVCMDFGLVATAILMRYAEYGFAPEVVPPLIEDPPIPTQTTYIQNGSDRDFLYAIARRVGYTFYVAPGPVPMANQAYFGPPKRVGVPQPTLNVNVPPWTNVTSIDFTYDPLQATLVSSAQLETAAGPGEEIPVDTFATERLPPLSLVPALVSSILRGRESLIDAGGADVMQTWQLAQARTDLSTDDVARANGELDGLAYGYALTARGLVALRGAGLSYDGLWYVKSVVHELTRGSYVERFTLTRDGLESTLPVVPP